MDGSAVQTACCKPPDIISWSSRDFALMFLIAEDQAVYGSRPPKLLDRLRQELHAGYYSQRTEEAYVPWVKRFI
jgi:hypothetical protein